ncbi:RHS repeat-associated core domain-containing protein [Pseudomonas sp. AP-1]|uniref:RHS repeat-associated core domain-containing protein n=1 Tax=Pseudomonas sp. AP-1 TaxID=3231718 RepID=UPI0035B2C77E
MRIADNNGRKQNAVSRVKLQRQPSGSAPLHRGYSPYGYHSLLRTMLGFNGGRLDPVTGCYPLGNGRRSFNPSLLRFISSDSMSPFAAGGLNSYSYCLGDPVNREDPSGNCCLFKPFARMFRRVFPKKELPGKLYVSPIIERMVINKDYKNINSVINIRLVGSSERVPQGYELIGFHGSQAKHARSLESGLDPGYSKGGTYGSGFYFSTNLDVANKYAGSDGDGIVFGVYAENFGEWKKGKDYFSANRNVMVIRENAYGKVAVRREVAFPILISDKTTVTY